MILFRDCLNETEKTELRELIEACSQADGQPWSVPDDADVYFLLYGDDDMHTLLAALCVYHMGDVKNGLPIDELCVFTRPKARRRGYVRELLKSARPMLRPMLRFSLPEAPGEAVCSGAFISDSSSGSGPSSGSDASSNSGFNSASVSVSGSASVSASAPARQFLRHIGADFDHDEVLMELRLPCPDISYNEVSVRSSRSAATSPMKLQLDTQDGITEVSCRYGECFLSEWSDGVYLFGMLVYERFRGQGYGARILHALFERLFSQGCSRIVLEVASDNLPAVRLYQRMGFHPIERVSISFLRL